MLSRRAFIQRAGLMAYLTPRGLYPASTTPSGGKLDPADAHPLPYPTGAAETSGASAPRIARNNPRLVIFMSASTDIDPAVPPMETVNRVFLLDTATWTTKCISIRSGQYNQGQVQDPDIDDQGNYALFTYVPVAGDRWGSDWAIGAGCGQQVVVSINPSALDYQACYRITNSSIDGQACRLGTSVAGWLSGDGSGVTCVTSFRDLVGSSKTSSNNDAAYIFWKSGPTPPWFIASDAGAAGSHADGNGQVVNTFANSAMTEVYYDSTSTNILAGFDTLGNRQLYVRNTGTQNNAALTVDPATGKGFTSPSPALASSLTTNCRASESGRKLCFYTYSHSVVPPGSSREHVFRLDRDAGIFAQCDLDAHGNPPTIGGSADCHIDPTGDIVVMESSCIQALNVYYFGFLWPLMKDFRTGKVYNLCRDLSALLFYPYFINASGQIQPLDMSPAGIVVPQNDGGPILLGGTGFGAAPRVAIDGTAVWHGGARLISNFDYPDVNHLLICYGRRLISSSKQPVCTPPMGSPYGANIRDGIPFCSVPQDVMSWIP